MAPVATARLNNIVWKLHEQRGRNAELIELRKRYLERAYCAQIRRQAAPALSHRSDAAVGAARVSAGAAPKRREKEREIRNPASDE